VRIAPEEEQAGRVEALLKRFGDRPVLRDAVVLELLRLIRDHLGWHPLLDYLDTLPPALAEHPLVLEQRLLAVSELGDVAGSAGSSRS
jgi:hypothetical protein